MQLAEQFGSGVEFYLNQDLNELERYIKTAEEIWRKRKEAAEKHGKRSGK